MKCFFDENCTLPPAKTQQFPPLVGCFPYQAPPNATTTATTPTADVKLKDEHKRYKVALENIAVSSSFPMAKAMAHKALHPEDK